MALSAPSLLRVLSLVGALGAALLAGCSGDEHTVTIPPSPAKAPEEITLAPYRAGLRQMVVRVENRAATVIFDTGAGLTVISPELASEICEPRGAVVAHRMSGDRVQMARCENITLEIGGVPMTDDVVGVFDLPSLLPADWPRVDGFVGLSALELQPFLLDLGSDRLVLLPRKGLSKETAGFAPLDIRLSRPAAGVALDVFVRVDADDGGPLWLLLDSGNVAGILLAPEAAERLGASTDTAAGSSLGEGGPGMFQAPVALKIGGTQMTWEDLVTVKPLIYDGALDAGFLEAHVLIFDLARGRAWIKVAPPKPSAPKPSPDAPPPEEVDPPPEASPEPSEGEAR